MQDKTIDNALLALRKQGGHQGKLAEVLLDMRGVEWSGYVQDRPFKRGEAKQIVLAELRGGPRTNMQLGEIVNAILPDISRRESANRSYQALLRLESRGLVRRNGRLWGLAQRKANHESICRLASSGLDCVL